jgi:SH3 domain-containing YSC84-like protein 1
MNTVANRAKRLLISPKLRVNADILAASHKPRAPSHDRCQGAGMKRHLVTLLLFLAALGAKRSWAASAREDATERLQSSAQVLREIGTSPDKGIPDAVVQHSKCIVVIPHLVKAGLIAGGKYGRGVAVCRTSAKEHAGEKGGWSAPAFITIAGGSWGLQAGAEDLDLVMMVMNEKGLQKLLSDKFEFTLEGSVAAGPVGRNATVGADWKQNTEVLTYGRSKGVFAGQTLEGSALQPDAEATKAIYGSDVPFRNILSGEVRAPGAAAPFLKEVGEISHEAALQEARQQVPEHQKQQ